MSDVFDRLIGQERAVQSLRQYALAPVHAYLFSGPSGAGLRDALLTFAAALQCPDHGCGECEVCRLVLSEQDPDVYVAERSGVSWRMEEIREAERVSRRRPLGDGYQIIVLEDVDLTTTGTSPSASSLLKSLEEPPPRTIFLLSAEAIPEELDTILSRCVEVRLRALRHVDIEAVLVREGAPQDRAQRAAHAAQGNLERARVLVHDTELASRIEQWREVPSRLRGTPASATAVALELTSSLDSAMVPLQRLQEEELAKRSKDAKDVGQRSLANRRDIEAQFKREQRRFRLDELRFGFAALTGIYRERMIESVNDVSGNAQSEYRVGAALRAIDAVATAHARLSTNVDESLLLNDLLLSLMDY